MTSQRDFANINTGTHATRRRGGSSSSSSATVRKRSSSDERRPRPPRRERSRRRIWTIRLLKWGTISAVLCCMLAVMGYWALIFYFENRLPPIFDPGDYLKHTSQVTRVYSADGDVLAEIGDQRRTVVAPEDIPKLLKQAVLAAEDADFYDHEGLDYWGMARAMYKNVRDQRFSQGASTITQQVAKTFFLTSEKTISRKLKEVVLARRLEQKLTKDQILYLYLNQIYWGHGRYGLGEAARFYFGKDLKGLTLADAALLAGMIAAPERYSPFRDKDKAAERRAFVLDQMARHGFIAPERARAAKHEPIRLNFRGDPQLGLAPYAMDSVRAFLSKRFGPEVGRLGLRVETTIDARLQREAEQAIRSGLEAVDRLYDLAAPIEHISKARVAAYIHKLAKALPTRGIRSGEVALGVVTGIDRKAHAYRVHVGLGPARLPFSSVERYRGRLEAHELYEVGDVVRVSPRHPLPASWDDSGNLPAINLDQGPQSALVAIDPKTRHIKALVGGYDHGTHPFNRAQQARRQAGSTFKPIVFAAAIESGIVEPLTELRNVPETYRMGRGRYWKPKNFNGKYDGKVYTARMALAKSINVIAVKILEDTKLKRATHFARRIGITSDIPQNLSVALGSVAVSPQELTGAYATFASGGWAQESILVTRVTDAAGKVLYEAPVERKRATTAKVAYRITEMLQAVVSHGTGKRARSIGRSAAGKTGTTDHGVDTWFAGYTPELVCSVWVGFDDLRPVRKATGGRLAAPIWARFMTAALEGTPVGRFEPPAGVQPLPDIRSMALAHRSGLPAKPPGGAEPSEELESDLPPASPSASDGMELLYE